MQAAAISFKGGCGSHTRKRIRRSTKTRRR
jgi:hypothetical protein